MENVVKRVVDYGVEELGINARFCCEGSFNFSREEGEGLFEGLERFFSSDGGRGECRRGSFVHRVLGLKRIKRESRRE